MLHIKRLGLLLLCAAAAWAMAGAATVVTICGDRYVGYTAVEKSTIHRVANALEVAPEVVLRYNPWAANGLAKGETVFIPADKSQLVNVSRTDFQRGMTVKYTLGYGDDIYTVAQRFDTSVESLIAANPTVRPGDYAAGTTVTVAAGSSTPLTVERKTVTFERYKLRGGDSYYMLAKKNGLSENDLVAANPGVEQLKKGKNLIIPTVTTGSVTDTPAGLTVAELRNYYGHRVDALFAAVHATAKKSSGGANVAIVLPFQLHKSQPPRQALLYTDFYKGVLIGLDSIARRADKPKVNLTVLDTEHNLNVTDSLLASGTLDDMDVIVAPLEPKQMERIVNYGAAHDIAVLNCFATKDDSHQNKSNVYQVNVPMPVLTASVVDWVAETMPDCSVIFVTDAGADEEAEAFATLRDNFALSGLETSSISIGSGELGYSELSLQMLPGSRYLIVPSNGSRSLLKRILPALKKAKEERFDCELQLLGYPEYVIYLKDFQTELQNVDTFMFSRFFNSNGYRTRDMEYYYNKWFKGTMLSSYPNMVLYGYDTIMYIVNALSQSGSFADHTALERGIQTPYRFVAAGDGADAGYINNAVCIVHFTPNHTIETIVR